MDYKLKPPGVEDDEQKLVKYIKDRCYKSSPLYAEDFSRFRKSELYDQGDQWLKRAFTTRDSRYPSQWVRRDAFGGDKNEIALPVYNEMVALRENESARLGRPEYKPRVKPKGENPDITAKEGAKGAEQALASRLKDLGWDEGQERLCYHMPMFGGAFLLSYWDQTWMDTVRVPMPAVVCSRNPKSGIVTPQVSQEQMVGPGQVIEEPRIPGAGEVQLEDGSIVGPDGEQRMPPVIESMQDVSGGLGGEVRLGVEAGQTGMQMEQEPCDFEAPKSAFDGDFCPQCESPLVDYKPTMEEAQGSLGQDIPRGDWVLKVPLPYQIFVRDAGLDVDNKDIDEFVYAHVERLSWLEERYPDKVRDIKTGQLKIQPENPASLMAEDPTLGSPIVFQSAQMTGVFREHVLVYEYVCKPKMYWDQEKLEYRRDRGRYTVMANGRICIDTDLMAESFNQPGERVARMRLEYVVWEPREGGRRTTVGQSLWDRLFDAQDGVNRRMAQVWAVNERGALPFYLQARGRNFETRGADAAVPFRRILVDIDPNDKQLPLTLMQNTTIDSGVYTELDHHLSYATRVSGQVEVEQGRVPPNVGAATAIAYLKTESGEKRRPRIRRIRGGLIRSWDHGLKLMSAFYIEPREYSYEDEFSEERWSFIRGDVIASTNPKVDVYPTPDYDVADMQRESIRDMVQLGILDPRMTPQLNRKIIRTIDPSLEFFTDDDLQEQQSEREWRDFKDRGKVPVIDPSLDDPMTHYQLHGQACFSAWFREQEQIGAWDEVLSLLGGDWDQITIQIAMARRPGSSIQTDLLSYWWQQVQLGIQQGMINPQDPAATLRVLQWRAHMEAHKLRALIQSSGIAAPARGSSPAPTSEQPGAPGPAAVA